MVVRANKTVGQSGPEESAAAGEDDLHLQLWNLFMTDEKLHEIANESTLHLIVNPLLTTLLALPCKSSYI